MKKVVYVAHPLAGDIPGNIERAKQICREIAHRRFPEVVPVCPLPAFSFLNDENPEERNIALEYCFALLQRCDELWLAGNWRESEGCRMEKELAEKLGIPVKEYTEKG